MTTAISGFPPAEGLAGQLDATPACGASTTEVHLLAPAERKRWDDYVAGRHTMNDSPAAAFGPAAAVGPVGPVGAFGPTSDGSMGSGQTFFHGCAWMAAVGDTFGHRAHYLSARRHGRLVGVLPMFEVQSLLAGRLLVSVPYAVGGGVLADDAEAGGALLEAAIDEADRRGARCIDLRSTVPVHDSLPIDDRYVGFWRRLPDRVDDVAAWLPRKARAVGRRARHRYGLSVAFDDRRLRAVWTLYARSMRRLGSINYPYRFFESLLHHTPGGHLVSVVLDGRRPVAGLVSFLFQDTVIPYFAGCDERCHRLGGNHLAYLSLMERAVEMGFRVFDFGRSRPANSGSFDFKRFHGFEPRLLGYQFYVPPGGRRPDLTPSNPRYRLGRALWRRLPLWATRPLGAALARHIPG